MIIVNTHLILYKRQCSKSITFINLSLKTTYEVFIIYFTIEETKQK